MGRKSRKQTVKWFNGGAPQFITPLNVRDMKTLGIITEIEQEKNMTRTEFEQRVKDENLKMEDYSIELDEYREEIRVMGCVQKNGKWVIYETSERDGSAYVIKEFNNENEAFEYFYKYVIHQIKREKL